MKLTDIDINVLRTVADYYVMSATQIHRVCFPHNKDRRATRRRLQRLVENKHLARSGVNVAFSGGNSGPAYYPAKKGVEALSLYYDDAAWLATNIKSPRLDRLYHWLDVTEAHIIVERAVADADGVELCRWVNEWETVNKDAAKDQQYALHTQLRKTPPLSCSPDAAFMLDIQGHRRVHYVEIDRGTSGARRIAASKTPGYAELVRTQSHRLHFPDTTIRDDFAVLLVTVSVAHRDAIAREIAKMSKNRPDLWLFINRADFTPENVLYAEIAMDHLGSLGPLLHKPIAATSAPLAGAAS